MGRVLFIKSQIHDRWVRIIRKLTRMYFTTAIYNSMLIKRLRVQKRLPFGSSYVILLTLAFSDFVCFPICM